ncbi:MAG: ATP-binding protein [Bacteroidaceae bacterium]|nr:ATP-binding protein [Bacteroidaceae bacterium]
MKVDSFVIEGISNISRLKLNVGSLNALIAPNGYGKSNVLRAIGFGIEFISASEQEKVLMMRSRFVPINNSMYRKNFRFEIFGSIAMNGLKMEYHYGYTFSWATGTKEGRITSEWLKVKRCEDQRLRQIINRPSTDECLILPSPTGRCTKSFEVPSSQLALSTIAMRSDMYLNSIASQICTMTIPNLETLDNPESYFSVDGDGERGIRMLDGETLSSYLYKLKTTDEDNYAILIDGLLQLLPGIEEFSPEVITLADGRSKIYDIRVKERFNSQPTSIRQLSSGSKRIIFLFTLSVAAQKRNIPMIMLEEPENSVHPRLMENLLLAMQNYASDTKILITSHSPYLMRYLQPQQMYFGLPKGDGIAHFAQVNPSKMKSLYRYAGDMELTFGEFMFDFMLDIENDTEKISTFFKAN